jgi:hypothetical protein
MNRSYHQRLVISAEISNAIILCMAEVGVGTPSAPLLKGAILILVEDVLREINP